MVIGLENSEPLSVKITGNNSRNKSRPKFRSKESMSGFNQYGAISLHRIQRTVKILPLRARLQFLAAITDLLKICKTKFTFPPPGRGAISSYYAISSSFARLIALVSFCKTKCTFLSYRRAFNFTTRKLLRF